MPMSIIHVGALNVTYWLN